MQYPHTRRHALGDHSCFSTVGSNYAMLCPPPTPFLLVCATTQVNASCKEACATLQQDSTACKELVGGLVGQVADAVGGLRKKYGIK
jgi:hypothetical protein